MNDRIPLTKEFILESLNKALAEKKQKKEQITKADRKLNVAKEQIAELKDEVAKLKAELTRKQSDLEHEIGRRLTAESSVKPQVKKAVLDDRTKAKCIELGRKLKENL